MNLQGELILRHKSHRAGKSRILSRNESVCHDVNDSMIRRTEKSRVLTNTEPVFHAPENKELATSGQSGMGSPEISPMHKDGEPYSDNTGKDSMSVRVENSPVLTNTESHFVFCGPEHNKYRSINSSGDVTCEVCNK